MKKNTRYIKIIVAFLLLLIYLTKFNFEYISFNQVLYILYLMFIVLIPYFVVVNFIPQRINSEKNTLTKYSLKIILALLFCIVVLFLNSFSEALFKSNIIYIENFIAYPLIFYIGLDIFLTVR